MTWPCFMVEKTGDMEWRDLPDGPGRVGLPQYRFLATGEVRLIERALPIGAMFYSDEAYDIKRGVGPDGRCLYVVTPGGYWPIDHPSSGPGPGWLHDGVLSDDVEGRTFPEGGSQ